MSTAVCALLALGFSLGPLLRLALRDPKRLRSHRAAQVPATTRERRLLCALLLLPGLALAVLGEWPAWLIWLGSLAAGGWALSMALARPRPAIPPA